MAESHAMRTGDPPHLFVALFCVGIMLVAVYTSYATFAKCLKWMTAVLVSYVVAAFIARPDWRAVLHATVVPEIRWDPLYVGTLVGVLGTTISPYLFFWQASQEVEEEKARGKRTAAQRRGATAHELSDARLDVNTGMFFSNLVMYFIILATASTLHRAGIFEIETGREA